MDWLAFGLTAGLLAFTVLFVIFEERFFIPRGWHWLRLVGASHVIPRCCPNCLGPADVPLRVGFVGVFHWMCAPWGGSYQTFYYCGSCAESARAFIRYRRVLCFFTNMLAGLFPVYFPLGIAAYFLAVVPATALRNALPESWGGYVAIPVGVVLGLMVMVGGIKILASFLKGLMMGRTPLREGQAARGLAAYYVNGTYWAARYAWIRALGEANADLFDPAAFEKIFGIPHPSPGPKSGPFR